MNYSTTPSLHASPRRPASPPHRLWLLALLLSSFAISHSSFAADAPTLIPFQARLTNQQGVAYGNGTYTITFNIYSDAVGGSTNWTERHEKVGVVNGMVNVFLGSIQPFTNVQANPNDDVDFSTTRYLGITVDADDNPATADPEMVPRQMIIPAFYAKNSQKLAGYDWTPLLAGGSNNPQTGFLNGAKLGSGTVTNVQIQDGGITTSDIGNAQITGEKMAPGAADAAISNESITSQKIKDGEVKTGDLADSAVVTSKIAPEAVTSAQVGDNSINPVKLNRDIAIFEDVKPQYTNGGSSVSGWQVRTLNTSHFLQPGLSSISRTSNTITLQPGTYYFRASLPAVGVYGPHQAALVDVTGSPASNVYTLLGTSESAMAGPDAFSCSRSLIEGFVTVTNEPRSYELKHFCQGTNTPAFALGDAVDPPGIGAAPNCIYTRVVIERVR